MSLKAWKSTCVCLALGCDTTFSPTDHCHRDFLSFCKAYEGGKDLLRWRPPPPPRYTPLHPAVQLLEENGEGGAIGGVVINVVDKPVDSLTPKDFDGRQVDAVVGEPFFLASLLPWHDLYLWYAVTALGPHLSPHCVVLPARMSIRGVAGKISSSPAPMGIGGVVCKEVTPLSSGSSPLISELQRSTHDQSSGGCGRRTGYISI